MSRWPEWIDEATTPGDAEVTDLDGFASDALRDAVIQVTDPTDDELERLLVRRPWTAPSRSGARPWMLGGVVALAAAAALVLVITPTAPQDIGPAMYGDVAMALHEPVAVGPTVMHLGPSIDMSGAASVVVDQASEAGTALTLVDGRVHFDVDPQGSWRDLSIDADGVQVRVHGTVFDVMREQNDVRVEVERGRVSVTWQGEEVFITGGSAWTRPPTDVAVVVPRESAPVQAVDGVADATAVPERRAPAVVLPSEGSAQEAPEQAGVDALPEYRVVQGSADHELAQILALKSSGLSADALLVETDAVLSRHRGSGVSMEIELVRLQTLAQVDPVLASIEMADWLDAHPNASRAPLVRFERARVTHRALGRCASALGDYRELAQRTDDLGTRAAAGAGLCAAELGSTAAAIRYLDQALEGGLQGSLLAEVRAVRSGLEQPNRP